MTGSASEQSSARERGRDATRAARAHDVVMAASKAIYGQPLTDTDRDALRWAEHLLGRASSTEVITALPGAMRLADDGQEVRTLRQALDDESLDAIKALRHVARDAARWQKAGHPTKPQSLALEALRRVFLISNRMSLNRQVQKQGHQDPGVPWARSTMSLSL